MLGLHPHAHYRHPKREALSNFLVNFAGAAVLLLYYDSTSGCLPSGFKLYTIMLGAAVYAVSMAGVIHGFNTKQAAKTIPS